MDDQQFLTVDEFNELAPVGTLVSYYPVRKADGTPDPRFRQRHKIQTPARRVACTSSVVTSLDGLPRLVSIGQLKICLRRWLRIKSSGRFGEWQAMTIDSIELAEIKSREHANGNSIEYRSTAPERIENEKTLFGQMMERVIATRLRTFDGEAMQ